MREGKGGQEEVREGKVWPFHEVWPPYSESAHRLLVGSELPLVVYDEFVLVRAWVGEPWTRISPYSTEIRRPGATSVSRMLLARS